MGKTVPLYRIAIESEIASWKGFRDGLTTEEEKQAFDEVMDMCRMQAAAGSCATNPILFEPMIMSVLLGQQKRIRQLQRKIDALLISMLPIEKNEG
jgi:hypothetical protein